MSGLIVVLACVAAGCGGDDAADELRLQQQLRQEREEGRREERQRQLERELRALKRSNKKPQAQQKKGGSSGASPPSPPPSAGTSCGNGVSVGPNTTCGFAFNVQEAYYNRGGGTVTIQAASPTTGMIYTMTCTAGAPTLCKGGDNASVFIQ